MSVATLRELAASENDDVLTEMLTAGLDMRTTYSRKKMKTYWKEIWIDGYEDKAYK